MAHTLHHSFCCAGVSAEMMAWWLANIEGDAPYAGDGKVWPKYLQWWVYELHTLCMQWHDFVMHADPAGSTTLLTEDLLLSAASD
jgi:hypothetical protein